MAEDGNVEGEETTEAVNAWTGKRSNKDFLKRKTGNCQENC